jgi:small subunit ribosomal protein S1
VSDTNTASEMNPTQDDFAALLEQSFAEDSPVEGSVVEGRITAIENDLVIIDVGLKTEGRVPLREFSMAGQEPTVGVGDRVEVFLERIENAMGEAMLSRDKARREESWTKLEQSFAAEERVEGVIFGRVKGGFTVDLNGATAFLPGSQVDIRPVRDVTPLMNTKQPFQILKMDRRRGNIVVSRRAIMEETRAEARSEIVQNLVEGQAVDGVVKNITDYGAFVDLGGVDGLLHVTDIAWRRVNHPSEVLTVGETVRVQVIKINSETQRISLGMKQLETDPWDDIEARFPLETRVTGRVTNITDYGAFVELGSGIEGLVHVSEMSWVKKNVHPGKIVSTSQEVEVMVLEVDSEKRRISLGLKQCMANPWEDFASRYPVGTKVSGEIKNITEFGLFVGLEDEIDGMVHMSDLDWNLSGDDALAGFSKGQTVEAVVLDVDMDKERVSLGVKQLDGDPFETLGDLRRGSTVTCEVTAVTDGGLEVGVGDADVSAFIRRSDLSRDREDQRPERFNVGDKIDAMVTNIDQRARRIGLSIKALEIAEEKEAVEQYGSSDSGASLGDILGAALNRDDADTEEN